jgi:HNH endonuclease
MTFKPQARAAALKAGNKRYLGGRPCKVHGDCERFASDGHCVQCTNNKFWKWYESNKDRVVANTLQWRKDNPERAREQRLKELPKNRIRVRQWAKDHPDHARALASTSGHARRARKQGATGKWTVAQIEQLLIKQNHRCAACKIELKKKFHRDHIVALARGGSNEITNIQLLCAFCNQSKGIRHHETWLREQGLSQ